MSSRVWIAWCLSLGSACSRLDPPSPTADRTEHTTTPALADLEVVPVASRPLSTTAHLQGELMPFEVVAVYPRTSGFVQTITVDRASRVHRGQLLVRITAPELAAQRAEAEARVRGDQTTLDRLRAAAQTPGVVAGHDIELAAAAVEADRARVRSLHDLEQYLTVTAPFDGVVTERNVHPGALVGPQPSAAAIPMLRIAQITQLRLVVAVPENLAGEITEGIEAHFTVRAWPQVQFTGTIRRPSHTIDVRTRTEAVEIDVDNADGRLAPGMYADVAWPVRRLTPTLFVPPSAIVQTISRTFVVRVRNGVVDQVDVQRGMGVDSSVEVFGQLNPGDQVARRGSDELRPGTAVTTHLAQVDASTPR